MNSTTVPEDGTAPENGTGPEKRRSSVARFVLSALLLGSVLVIAAVATFWITFRRGKPCPDLSGTPQISASGLEGGPVAETSEG